MPDPPQDSSNNESSPPDLQPPTFLEYGRPDPYSRRCHPHDPRDERSRMLLGCFLAAPALAFAILVWLYWAYGPAHNSIVVPISLTAPVVALFAMRAYHQYSCHGSIAFGKGILAGVGVILAFLLLIMGICSHVR